ncbi:MAG: hypothetical protein AABY01_00675 [Nanoarchaeota archaeon]|mgnify:FL=1
MANILVAHYGGNPDLLSVTSNRYLDWEQFLDRNHHRPVIANQITFERALKERPELVVFEGHHKHSESGWEQEASALEQIAAKTEKQNIPLLALVNACAIEYANDRIKVQRSLVRAAQHATYLLEQPYREEELVRSIATGLQLKRGNKPYLSLANVSDRVRDRIYDDMFEGMRKSPWCLRKNEKRFGRMKISFVDEKDEVSRVFVDYKIIGRDIKPDNNTFLLEPGKGDSLAAPALLQLGFRLREAFFDNKRDACMQPTLITRSVL